MDLSGEYEIAAPRILVWALLNDQDVLKQCIPGCEELVAHGPNAFTATLTLKIGPIKARFTGELSLSNKVILESYTITGEGRGGIVGFAKGVADVRLTEMNGNTTLHYTFRADIGGKIAQLGSRLIVSKTKKLADQFFGTFAQIASAPIS